MEHLVLVEKNEGWVEITLNRPERLNSFTEDMHVQLRQAFDDAAADKDVRAVLLTGAGRGFCAGQDLEGRDPRTMTEPPDLSKTLTSLYNPLIRQIRNLRKPVVCAVNGVAAGAGANLALACDIVVASESAKFIQSFSKVGLIPDAGGTWSLTHLLGPVRAKALAMTAEPVTATDAVSWGMIWKAYPPETYLKEARALTSDLASGATFGLAQAKAAIHAAGDNTLDAQLDLEAKLQGQCGRTADYREGVTAFLEKRAPVFTGEEP